MPIFYNFGQIVCFIFPPWFIFTLPPLLIAYWFAFKKFDANNDGAIDSKELAVGLKNSGVCLTDQEIETIFAVADIDGDGQIDISEFGQLLGVDKAQPGRAAPAAGGKIVGIHKTSVQFVIF